MIIARYLLVKKKLYHISNDCNEFGVDVDDYIFNDHKFFHEDYGDYDYFDNDNDYDYYYDDHFDDDDDDDDDDDFDDYYFYNEFYCKKPFTYFERLVSVKNNIVNWIDNDDYNH